MEHSELNLKVWDKINGVQRFDYANDIEACTDMLIPILMGYYDGLEIKMSNSRGKDLKFKIVYEVVHNGQVMGRSTESMELAICLAFIKLR